MKAPWSRYKELKQKVERLQEKVEELEQERDRYREQFNSEQERRKKLSRQKQEAEEELNRLKDRIRSLEDDKEDEKNLEEDKEMFKQIGFKEACRALEKLDTRNSPEEDLVTVYSPQKLKGIDDLSGLKNSLTGEQYGSLNGRSCFAAFLDTDLGSFVLKTVPFFEPGYHVGQEFDVGPLLDFIRKEKHWVLVSAGETLVFREENGRYKEIERVKSRVDRKHSSGGFSQGRFERKREEQIESHIEQVEKVLEDYEELCLLGDERLCEELSGEYLGGFDPNRGRPEQFYRFQKLVF